MNFNTTKQPEMALYVSFPVNVNDDGINSGELEQECWTPVPTTFIDFFGDEGYNYLVYHPDFDYEHNGRGPKSVLVTTGYRIKTLKWRYQYDTKYHNEPTLTDEQLKHIYVETESCRSVIDRFNLYDLIQFLHYYDSWKHIMLTVTWPMLPNFKVDYEDTNTNIVNFDVNNIGKQTTIMTAEQLLCYGIVWDPVDKVDLRVRNYTLWDTFHEVYSIVSDNEYICDRINDDTRIPQHVAEHFSSPNYRFLYIAELGSSDEQIGTLVKQQNFDHDPYLEADKMLLDSGTMLRLVPTIYYDVYDRLPYTPDHTFTSVPFNHHDLDSSSACIVPSELPLQLLPSPQLLPLPQLPMTTILNAELIHVE